MASSRARHLLVALALAGPLSACGKLALPRLHPDAGNDATNAGDWRAPAAFIGGTRLIDLVAPERCQEMSGSLPDLTFQWTPSGEARVYVGVFDEKPGADNGAITNPDHVVWAWMTGSGQSDAGEVLWRQGFRPDSRGLPDLASAPPEELAAGVYWLVSWAANDSRQVVASSETRPFLWNVTGDVTPYCCDIETSTPEGVHFWCEPDGADMAAGDIACDPPPTCP